MLSIDSDDDVEPRNLPTITKADDSQINWRIWTSLGLICYALELHSTQYVQSQIL